MKKSQLEEMKKVAIKAFEKNEENFYRELRRILRDNEVVLDETTTIRIVANYDQDLVPYFAFNYESTIANSSSDYYPPYFKRERKDNIDMDSTEDVELYVLYGNEVPKQKDGN